MNELLATRQAEAESAALLEATAFQKFCYGCVRVGGNFSLIYGFSYRSRGWHHVPAHGPALLIANHQSYLDPVVVGVATRRHLSYLARKTLFTSGFFTWAIRVLQAVPVDQEGTGIDGIRTVLKLLNAGKAVLVFPEGERCGDGKVHPLQPGVHLLIKRSGAPVIPVGIAGAFEAWPRSQPLPIPAPVFLPQQKRTIACVIGAPLQATDLMKLDKPTLLTTLYDKIDAVQREAEHLRRGIGRS